VGGNWPEKQKSDPTIPIVVEPYEQSALKESEDEEILGENPV
jgi:hypothetical protein